jgi:signal peptidase|tara:strand:+ start:1423 stop:2310 length:888 start_codon:yes stop_codon:yes gene_type:complete
VLSDDIKLYFREALLAIGLVFLLLGSMWLATGMFPPMVVVESGSMKHTDEGSLGAIDPGDLILVMNTDRVNIITFVEASDEDNENYGYEKHGMYGDVIIYQKNGGSDTPVIHRALLKAIANHTASPIDNGCSEGVFDEIENICILTWDVPGSKLVNVEEISLTVDYSCAPHGNLTIDRWVPKHEGYLTTGDNRVTNGCTIDQLRATNSDADDDYIRSRGLKDENGQPVTAVRDAWVVGVASSEIPWVGAIKLFFSGTSDFVSPQTWSNLVTLIAAVVILPMLFDIFSSSKDEEEE